MKKFLIDESRGTSMTKYCLEATEITIPSSVVNAARRAFVDYLGCTLSALRDPAVVVVRDTVAEWQAHGRSTIFGGFDTAPPFAALVNGTAAHALDLDDTLPQGAGHPSAPCWSAALALAQHEGSSAKKMMAAYIAGFEIMARLGGGGPNGVGRNLQRLGFHPTSVAGRIGAAAIGSILGGLNRQQTEYAFGVAATTISGFQSSHGTDAKPFHAGKAAMDGLISAQLAKNGLNSHTSFYEGGDDGLLGILIQDGNVAEVPQMSDLGENWHILGNSFKPYACCRATHAASEAALQIYERTKDKKITSVMARTAPSAIQMAGYMDPQTPNEAKFSLPYCIAMVLAGYKLVPLDFTFESLQDSKARTILPMVSIHSVDGQPTHEAQVTVTTEDGETYYGNVLMRKGDPENPFSWSELKEKFLAVTIPFYGQAVSDRLAMLAAQVDKDGAFQEIFRLVRENNSKV